MIEILAQIEGDKFRAGVVLWNGRVVEAAPIVGFMKKQKLTRDQVRKYCERKGWKISVVWQMERPHPEQFEKAMTDRRAKAARER